MQPTGSFEHLCSYILTAADRPGFAAAPVVERLLGDAVRAGASDVIFEPLASSIAIRLRIDGVYHELVSLPLDTAAQLLLRMKVLASIQSHQREAGQEGRFTFAAESGPVDLRVSFVPTIQGERLAIRVLDRRHLLREWEDLGLADGCRAGLDDALQRGRGVVVVVGPAGSGKTTTLYSALRRIHARRSATASLVTIEDPVELVLDFAAQIPVDRSVGRDFANALRLVLRQDPEVLLVGEVRDRETAEVALEAGLTGHLVLTTLHAGDPAEALVRLLDMGIPRFVVASAINGILAQRLMRRVCPSCVVAVDPLTLPSSARAGAFRMGRGCPACHGTGCQGRTAVGDWLSLDAELRREMRVLTSAESLTEAVRRRGHAGPLADAWRLARQGQIAPDEVLRVFGAGAIGICADPEPSA